MGSFTGPILSFCKYPAVSGVGVLLIHTDPEPEEFEGILSLPDSGQRVFLPVLSSNSLLGCSGCAGGEAALWLLGAHSLGKR